MIEIQAPPIPTASHYMGSQSGNIQDIGGLSSHSSSLIIGSEEPDSSSRQDFLHSHSQPSDMGLRYMTLSPSDDVRFPESGNPSSPESSVSNYAPSSFSISPYTPLYHHTLSGGPTYTNAASNYYSHSTGYLSMTDKQPRLSSFNASSGLAPLSRSPALPHPSSPINTRDLYTGATPHLRRTSELLSRSPSLPSTVRGVPLSPSSNGGFTSPTNMESSLGGAASPPLLPTEVIYQLQATDGQVYKPEIYGRIDKGFFMADKDWTCYRRNYFSLNCSYTISPSIPTGNMTLLAQHGGGTANGLQVFAFSMSIAAVVDGHDGKAIELVQHTPKRDKGPQQRPDRVTLQPRQPHQHGGMYGGDSSMNGSRGLYDSPGFSPNSNQNFSNGNPVATEASFERIQFKNATANNGKRRAAQQYYHLIVELFADVGQQHPERWVKIATRISAQMVVRGRSPGHYQGERRGSNASSGPGSGGASGGGSYTPGSVSRTPGDMSMSGSASLHQSSSYGGGYDGRSQPYRSTIAPLQIPLEGMMSTEESKNILESPGYLYFPSPMYESNESRYQPPRLSEYATSKIKHEYPSGYLPSMNFNETLSRPCGRWEGFHESKGHFPTALIQHEMNIT